MTKMYIQNETITLPKLCLSNGLLIDIEHELLTNSIFKALKASGNPDRFLALNLCDKLFKRILLCKKASQIISIYEIQDMAEFVLLENNQFSAAREFKTIDIDNAAMVF